MSQNVGTTWHARMDCELERRIAEHRAGDTPRSLEYHDGFRYGAYRAAKRTINDAGAAAACPHEQATPQADAWHAGCGAAARMANTPDDSGLAIRHEYMAIGPADETRRVHARIYLTTGMSAVGVDWLAGGAWLKSYGVEGFGATRDDALADFCDRLEAITQAAERMREAGE